MTKFQIYMIDQALSDRIQFLRLAADTEQPRTIGVAGESPDGLDGKRWLERQADQLVNARAAFRAFHNYNGEIVHQDE